MALNADKLLNWPFEDVVETFDEDDTILYALGIGIGHDPLDRDQLRYVYEKHLRAFPTMAVVLGMPKLWSVDPAAGVTRAKVVYGEQSLTVHAPLPVAGRIRAREKITHLVDKGADKGALILVERRIVDDKSGVLLSTSEATIFCRADGGFGGSSVSPRESRVVPDTPPDLVIDMPTLRQSALLYRLNGDRNPLHVDPDTAASAGFPEPILHGLCTWGIAAHAVVRACCDYDDTRLRQFQARFSRPVFPGDVVTIEIWRKGEDVFFQGKVNARGVKVLDNGYARIAWT